MDVKKILFIDVDRIGDIVRSTALFRLLRRRYPTAYIACLAAEPGDQILKRDPHIDTVIVMPHREIREILARKETVLHMCFPVFKTLDALKLQEFDLIINPYSEFGAMAARYLNPKYMLGHAMRADGTYVNYGKEAARFYLIMNNIENARGESRINFTCLYLNILKDLGIDFTPQDIASRIYCGIDNRYFADEFLKKNGFDAKKITIGMQLGAFIKEKMWPVKNFIELIKRISARWDVNIILNGSKHEAETLVEQTVAAVDAPLIVAAGKTTLMQAAAIIERCDFFISNDTGPMHIAAAVEVPVIALFGSTHTVPHESYPWGDNHEAITEKRIEDISVERVFEAVCKRISILEKSCHKPQLFQ